MFMHKHFHAASLFPAMAIMTSIAIPPKRLRRFKKQHDVALNGRFIEISEFSFVKRGKCTKLDKN